MHATRIAAVALLATLALSFAPSLLGARGSDTDPLRPHRLYDDKGTLDWSKKLADAQKVAEERRKLILIEFGRES